MTRLLLAVPALLAVVALSGALRPPDFAAAESTASDTVVVSGVGSVKTVPDEAQLSLGVESRGETAKNALTANAAVMRKVIAALRGGGAADLQTEYVSVWPVSGRGGAITGYSASNSVSATVAVEKAGELIDAATTAGATDVSGPGLSQSDSDRLYRKALAAAVVDARERAEALAIAAGRSLGAITTISEGGAESIPYPERASVAGEAATPVVPGRQETSATVSVTFELR